MAPVRAHHHSIMHPSTQAQALRQLRQQPTWKLLSAENGPTVMALIQAHLLEGPRRLPASLLVERIGRDLERLRAEGFDMPQPASAYLADWLAAGWLERSLSPEGEEEYEASAAAVQAIRFAQELASQRTVATESRLGLVIGQLTQLAEETEPDPAARAERLLRERERLDARIAAVRAGRLEPLPADRALERLREILSLSDELASDFRRVRDDFRSLNRDLRERIVDNDGSRGDVLEAVFADVDLIADSDAGKTFRAFWRLLTDPQQSGELEAALEAVLGRDFAARLGRRERRELSDLTGTLLTRGGEVHDVLYQFARGLKQFVQSREYREQRRMSTLVKTAQRRSLAVKERLRPQQSIGRDLTLSSASLRSVSQLRLHDPSLDAVNGGFDDAAESIIGLDTIAELVAQSEIDLRTLEEHVATLLADRGQVTVAELLAEYPAEQGLGTVVGYLALGARDGVVAEAMDRIRWRGRDGIERSARIPRIYFVAARGQTPNTADSSQAFTSVERG
ncbi:MAG: DUF3375 domain-containing protein [Thiohalocapsa sp.]|jgi:hypothetical protein